MSIQESLQRYKETGYGLINSTLNEISSLDEIKDEEVLTDIHNIDSVMKEGPEIRLYRGMNNLQDILSVTTTIPHKNFCSTSKDINIASKFISDKCCVLSFLLPSSIKRYDFNDIHEKEVLLQRNIQFDVKLQNTWLLNGITIYNAVVHPYQPPPPNRQIEVRSADGLDIQSLAADWLQELQLETFGKVDKDDIVVFVRYKSIYNFEDRVYQQIIEQMIALSE